MFGFIRNWKRRRIAREPFPERWNPLLEARLPFVAELEDDERERFQIHMHIFLREKKWIAAGGLDAVTEEMKVVISACAARLVRNLPLNSYDRLTEVIVYPASFTGEHLEGSEVFGLAHTWGTVVLAWDSVQEGIARPHDAHDTAIHEFAHALDVADGLYDGTPLLDSGADYRDWVRVLGKHFARLQESPNTGFLDAYGATNEAEFFAVATEAFFEQPRRLQQRAPDLYEQLRRAYRLDPARHHD